jgi:hypothetical protein
MRPLIGNCLSGVGMIGYWIAGLLGFIISLGIVHQVVGFWGVVIAFLLAPITFAVAPWYALIAWGNPFPLILNYGGLLFCALLQYIGGKISGSAT